MKYEVIRQFPGPGGRMYARGEVLEISNFSRGRQLTETRYVQPIREPAPAPVSARQRKEAKSA